MFRVPRRSQFAPISADHPSPWHEYVDLWLRFPLGRLLDYGCGAGAVLARVADRAAESWGVDVDADRLERARAKTSADIRRIIPGEPLPFSDGSFDTILIIEVIEHVPDERPILQELLRVLAPGGRLLLTTPHRGLLTFLDPGNVKFIAPALHRFVHVNLLGRRDYYERRFGQERRTEQGMIADFTAGDDAWHRHYRYADIRALAPPQLRTLAWRAYFPGMRALWSLRLALNVLSFGRIERLPRPLAWLFSGLSRCENRWGDQLVILFEKEQSHPRSLSLEP
jgi:SAM-dependent methyltransferase